MRLVAMVILTCLLITVCSYHAESSSSIGDEQQTNAAGTPDVRVHFKLPKLFNFVQFKELFGKVYGSALEEMTRQKIFLGRAFQVFISIIKYKNFKESYYLSVNPDSDQTPEERDRQRVDGNILSESLDLPFNHHDLSLPEEFWYDNMNSNVEEKTLPFAEEADIELELERIEQHKDEPDYKELALEVSRLKKQRRRKRDVSERSSVSVDSLFGRFMDSKLSPELERKIHSHPPSNNPNYEQPELSSSASNLACNKKPETPYDSLVKTVMNLSGANFVKNLVDDYQSKEQKRNRRATKKNVPDEVAIDLRDKNCLFQPRKQTGCGSCYAFTAIAYYEYMYCRQTGILVPFSEQYIVDCGHLTELLGCAGGRLTKTIVFVQKYGLELRHNYPYRAVKDTCPYEEQSNISPDPSKMGYIKVSKKNGFGLLALMYFEHQLDQNKPIMIALNLTSDFHDYGGGVHDKYDCDRKSSHAMLVIGYGIEDGIDYFLLRNSFSIYWGELGYYKISKEALYHCRSNDFGLVAFADFKSNDTENRNVNHEASVISERYILYMQQAALGRLKDLSV